MRHKKQTFTLDRKAGPRRALLRTLCISLIDHGSITTTLTKAQAVQQMIEPLVTMGKKNTLAAQRNIESALGNSKAAARMMHVISKAAADRPGGYTSLVKLAPRQGDGAQIARLSFIDFPTA